MNRAVARQPLISKIEAQELRASVLDRSKALALYSVSIFIIVPVYLAFVFAMKRRGRYKINNLEAVRAQYKKAVESDLPLIICSNHLTYIDSAIITWALGSLPWYLRNFKKFSWNLPAADVFKKKLLYRFIGYSAKCLFIHRDGTKEHKNSVLSICKHLLKSGEVVTLFPEGRRSRCGTFEADRLTFGVGKLVSELGPCNVLCVYLRSDKQENYSKFPPVGSNFHFDMQLVKVRASKPGREGYAQVVSKVSKAISSMEKSYFENLNDARI